MHGSRRLIHLERHPQGPRVYVLGRRVHECHLGLAILVAVLAGWAAHAWPLSLPTGAALVAAGWMILKDWRDIVPSPLRDTGSWRLGVHGRFAPLRALRYADGLPTLAGAVTLAIGIVNLLSALTPNIAWRHHALLQFEPVRAVPLFHTLAVPGSVALIVTSFYLRGARRRAWQTALVLLVALGVLDLVKGLDFEEAALSWAGAAVLWWGREAFVVRHARLSWRSPLALVAAAFLASTAFAGVAVWLASGRTAEPVQVARNVVDLFGWTHGSIVFSDELAWLPLAVGAFGMALIVAAASAFFRPLPPPREPPGTEARSAAVALVRAHGSDTLAFFKLRRDLHYLFSRDGRAFLGYRVEGRILLVAADPVGPADALPDLVRETCAFAEVRGLEPAVLGASAALVPVWRDAGLRALYIGDEAILETGRFSLEGRAIRKVRQSVSRLEKAGYTAEAAELAGLDDATHADLERISNLWRAGDAERGFSMAMDSLEGEHQDESVLVIARDASGTARGFLHFVPSFGRPAVSLSFMRRERDTPNGLTEFLVVKAVELLRARGVEEISLNFAAFGRLLERPSGRLERRLGRLVSLGNRYFQTESLYRFNVKFAPRWEPRYLVYERILGLPRVGLAAMTAEGQLRRASRSRG